MSTFLAPSELDRGSDADASVLQWCQSLWSRAEERWIRRTGQDHYYRSSVVVPALRRHIDARERYRSLIDLGAGDGHLTATLLNDLSPALHPDSLCLIDRSARQLECAKLNPLLSASTTIPADLTTNNWVDSINRLPSPRLLLSTFVLQELHSLDGIYANVASTLSADDTFIALVVAPSFSSDLQCNGKLKLFRVGNSGSDWTWCGSYPVSVDTGDILLPHFQRSASAYRRAGERHGLSLRQSTYLSVPDVPAARSVFSETVYGDEIIGVPSGLLLEFASDPLTPHLPTRFM